MARGIAAGAAAAMLPVFGMHLILAAALAWVSRGSLAGAAAACLAFGNPLTHALLIPAEYAVGRALLPHDFDFLPAGAPHWMQRALPAAEETLVGGLLFGLVAAAVAYLVASRALAAARPRN
nr:DUF2062 domain-containing protein [Roseomonas haemaphysalidis]